MSLLWVDCSQPLCHFKTLGYSLLPPTEIKFVHCLPVQGFVPVRVSKFYFVARNFLHLLAKDPISKVNLCVCLSILKGSSPLVGTVLSSEVGSYIRYVSYSSLLDLNLI